MIVVALKLATKAPNIQNIAITIIPNSNHLAILSNPFIRTTIAFLMLLNIIFTISVGFFGSFKEFFG